MRRGPAPASAIRRGRVRQQTLALVLAAASARWIPPAESSRAEGIARDRVSALVEAALEQTKQAVLYDPSYRRISYPGGDVPPDRGVCTDLVIRAFRGAGVDLQVLVHEDMKRAFQEYPTRWGRSGPDPNVDHRRVLNLMALFRRQGRGVPISRAPEDYVPGDLVVWRLPRGGWHIGIVSDRRASGQERYLIVHNLGKGPKLEDVLFAFEIIGHYRYF